MKREKILEMNGIVRELANLNPPVGVFFETEHIYTLDNTSEMMLALLSAAAQEESHTFQTAVNYDELMNQKRKLMR